MKTGVSMAMRCAVLPLALASTAAVAAKDDAWIVARAPNGAFLVETPCDAAEAVKANLATHVDFVSGVQFARDSLVLCVKDELIFFAGEVEAQPGNEPSVFDALVKKAASDKTAEGTASITVIDGRRAWVNREEERGAIAQTGVVEINKTRVVMLVAGAEEGKGLSVKDQGDMIDRFYASTKVSAQ